MNSIRVQRDPVTGFYNIWTPDSIFGSLCVGEIFKEGKVWCWRIDHDDANGREFRLSDAKAAALKAVGERV